MTSFVVVAVGLGEGRRGSVFNFFFDGKSVMSMFCNAMMLLLLHVHICVTRTSWKTRPWPKTVILSINKSNQIGLQNNDAFGIFSCPVSIPPMISPPSLPHAALRTTVMLIYVNKDCPHSLRVKLWMFPSGNQCWDGTVTPLLRQFLTPLRISALPCTCQP